MDSTKPKTPLKIDLRDGKARICPRCKQTSARPGWRSVGAHSKKTWTIWDFGGPLTITFQMYYCGYCHKHFGDPWRYEYGPKYYKYTYAVLRLAWEMIKARLKSRNKGSWASYPHRLDDIAERIGQVVGRAPSIKSICDWQTELEKIDDFHSKIEELSMPQRA